MGTGNDILTIKEEQQLVEHIKNIEQQTTGEIRIHIAQQMASNDPLEDAAHIFRKLKMDRTPYRNGVLIYVSVADRKVACIGDQAIHEKIDSKGWNKAVKLLQENFKRRNYFVGFKLAIEEVGRSLILHFPNSSHSKQNSLPDEISHS